MPQHQVNQNHRRGGTSRKQTWGASVSVESSWLIAHTGAVFFDVPYFGFDASRIVLFCYIFPCNTWKQKHLAGVVFRKLHLCIPQLELDEWVVIYSLLSISDEAVTELIIGQHSNLSPGQRTGLIFSDAGWRVVLVPRWHRDWNDSTTFPRVTNL